jgi:diguanylate cyclase (GGDEF)-like protein
MRNSLIFDPTLTDEELRAFSRTVAEIEWLTVILVLLYQVIVDPDPETTSRLALGTLLFAGFVLSFHYLNIDRKGSTWKIALETWVMIAFITWVLLHTGRLESPLANLYLLVIITTALTLGRAATLLQIALIAACYVWLAEWPNPDALLTYYAELAVQFAPMILVAYVTTMLCADIRRALTHIRSLSEKDELTGILNMRAFNPLAERIAHQSARYKHPYAVIMLDSDSLKIVNDRFGHQTGNRLLQLLVQCVQAHMRVTDVLARYGGDEFILLLPETDATGGEVVASRIRERVEAAVLSTQEIPVKTTISLGVAVYPEHGGDLEAVIEQADQALYASKSGGRNRVSVAPRRTHYISAAG